MGGLFFRVFSSILMQWCNYVENRESLRSHVDDYDDIAAVASALLEPWIDQRLQRMRHAKESILLFFPSVHHWSRACKSPLDGRTQGIIKYSTPCPVYVAGEQEISLTLYCHLLAGIINF
jgi:hypothetical protein